MRPKLDRVEHLENTCKTPIFSIPPYTPLYTPLIYLNKLLKRPLQRLLWTFMSQQRYLQVSTRFKDHFKTVFEAIRDSFDLILETIWNSCDDHEISRNFYTPSKLAIWASFLPEKINFRALNCSEKFTNVFFESKGTRNIFTTCLYDENFAL